MDTPGFAAAPPDGRRPEIALDPSQRRVIDLADDVSASVLGAPGSGKTTTLVELLADRVLHRGWTPEHILVLTPSRGTATTLRDVIALRLGLPTNGPLARTVSSLAFEIAGHAATRAGLMPPRLVTGGEQDSDLAQLIAGHLDDGGGPAWPDPLGPDVRALRGFRTELRDLSMRMTEYAVSTDRLRELAESHEHPEWRAAADFLDEYRQVGALLRPGQLDSAELVDAAIVAIDDGVLSERMSSIRLLLVDDLQEATESTLAILHAFAARGVAVIAFGDPDVATGAFRGGEPDALGRLGQVLGGSASVERLVLDRVHRHSGPVRTTVSAIVERIGTAGAGEQRRAAAVASEVVARESDTRPIIRIEASTPSREWAAIARVLREAHLLEGVDWRDMAVIVRSGAQVPVVARALALAEVPTRTTAAGGVLRDDRAARALLMVVDVGMGRTALTAAAATELLLGPFGGLDRLALRRLRLALRAEELAGDGSRSADELVVEALGAPGRFTTIDHRAARHAERLAATLDAVGAMARIGGTAEELLWLAWERSRLAATWRAQALGAGITATEAGRDLDGVLALFTAAKRFVERQPDRPASDFLEAVLDAEVPEDTLSPQAAGDSVLVTTPAGVVGLEFDIVAVAGVQEGVWPNLRLRGSLLSTEAMVEAVTGVQSAVVDRRRQVLGDELRMFALAVSRARRTVIVAAVANDDEAPSVLLGLLPPDVPVSEGGGTPLSLRGLTGRLRRELVTPGRALQDRGAAASALARLAADAVPGADPAQWHGLLVPSTDVPLFDDDEPVPVSPSSLAAFEDSALDWFVQWAAGSTTSTAMGVGTIVHWAMETAEDPSVDAVMAKIDERWPELVFESEWIARRERDLVRVLAAGVSEYLGDFARDRKTLVAAEGRFALDIGRARVNGSIDRVERSADGAVVIVDLKTGRPITRADDIAEHPQLRAYQLAYAEGVLDEFLAEHGDHRPGGAKLLFVKQGVRGKSYREAEQAALDQEQLEAFRERIRQVAGLMARAEFVGVVEPHLHGIWAAGPDLVRVPAVSSDGAGDEGVA